jgi:hypothetical protein
MALAARIYASWRCVRHSETVVNDVL